MFRYVTNIVRISHIPKLAPSRFGACSFSIIAAKEAIENAEKKVHPYLLSPVYIKTQLISDKEKKHQLDLMIEAEKTRIQKEIASKFKKNWEEKLSQRVQTFPPLVYTQLELEYHNSKFVLDSFREFLDTQKLSHVVKFWINGNGWLCYEVDLRD